MFKIIALRWKSFIRIIIVSILCVFLSNFFFASYYSAFEKINELENRFIITATIKDDVPSDTARKISAELEKSAWSKSIIYLSKDSARAAFIKKYGDISNDLMPQNTFPQLFKIGIKTEFFSHSGIGHALSSLKNIPSITNCDYNINYFESVLAIKQQTNLIGLIVLILITLIVIILIYLSAKIEFSDNTEDYQKIFELVENDKKLILKKIYFIIISGLTGIILAELLSFVLWYSIVGTLDWFIKTPYTILILSGVKVLFIYVIISLLSFLFLKKVSAE